MLFRRSPRLILRVLQVIVYVKHRRSTQVYRVSVSYLSLLDKFRLAIINRK
jgi:hypothetical protein